jgi:hypothetical protein
MEQRVGTILEAAMLARQAGLSIQWVTLFS